MRKNAKLLGAVAVAGIVAASGSAFTAASDIDNAAKHVGAVGQAISGVNVTNVQYTLGTNDSTIRVNFHVSQDLVSTDVITAKITSGTNSGTTADPVFASETKTCTPANTTAAGTDLVCEFTGVTNVTSLSIVAS